MSAISTYVSSHKAKTYCYFHKNMHLNALKSNALTPYVNVISLFFNIKCKLNVSLELTRDNR